LRKVLARSESGHQPAPYKVSGCIGKRFRTLKQAVFPSCWSGGAEERRECPEQDSFPVLLSGIRKEGYQEV
jgi:hypothetical protein